jgi:hypothetical protein
MKTKTLSPITAAETVFTKAQIAFQRGFLLGTPNKPIGKLLTKQEKFSIQAELMQFGYILSEEALVVVTIDWFKDVIPFLRKNLGVGDYTPFYKNFPQQVMELSHAELYWNAIIHYWSSGTWEPTYLLKERGFAFENTKFTTIKLGTEEDFQKIFTNLVSINQSITENDKSIIEWFIQNYAQGIVMPKVVPFKETLCMLAGHGLPVPVQTATDVLRIATYFSGGDISLPAVPKVTIDEVKENRKATFFRNLRDSQIEARDKFKFKNLPRARRKYLLSLLESINIDLGEMKLKLERWLRLGEVLHVGEYKTRFPKAYQAFNVLRNDVQSVQTFESKIDAAFQKVFETNDDESLDFALMLLSKRPGIFARKLDWLLRNFENSAVLETFKKISMKVSKKVLWELYNHFLNRDTTNARSVMIKGKKSIKRTLPELPPMNKVLINKIQNVILSCIAEHFSQLEKLGDVWIDEQLKNIPLPSGMRSVNTAVKTYVRGTRIPFNADAKVVRPYIHWFDQHGDEDLDLSVGFYNANLKGVEHISYTNLRSQRLNSVHSGDVRRRAGACAEYVDIDIAACAKNGVRYAMVQVHNFQNRPMHTMKDCVFGLMEREFPEANSIFVPKTITNAVKVANESSTVCIVLLDLVERNYIWVDCELESRELANLESTSNMTAQLIKGLINNSHLSVYDLLYLHAESRGTIVRNKEFAQTVFEYDDFVTSYEKAATFM